jgi:hypothetical protein
MSEKLKKHTVISPFIDKNTKEHYAVGSVYESDDADRISFLQEKGFLEAENDQEESQDTNEVDQYHTGGGYYELPNGEKVRGKEKALEALKALEQAGE